MAANKMTVEELQERLSAALFHQWLGLRVTEVTADGIQIRVPWRDEFVVNPDAGYAHGGILAALIDTASDYALAAKIGGPVPTVDLRVDYHRAALAGELRFEARVIKLGRTFSTAEASVFDEQGRLLASGRGVFHMPAS
jgi:uncharacterized protein (TIGR00369 family)